MAVITLDKIIFRNNDSYLKMYKGSELIAEVEQGGGLDYLTFTALEAGSTVTFSKSNYTSEYSLDNGTTWTSGDGITVTLTNIGDSVKYRGTHNSYASGTTTRAFTLTGQIKASGSIMSMINKDPNTTSFTYTYPFAGYFYGQTALKDITDLKLPATDLITYCYHSLFYGCTGITSIPTNFLPATSLSTSCYRNMFYNCSGITSIPSDLLTKVKNLSDYCCNSMFRDCTGITSIAEGTLPENVILTSNCYANMFYGCNQLQRVEIGYCDLYSTNAINSMFRNCSSLNYIKFLVYYYNGSISSNYFSSNVSSSGTFVKLSGQEWSSGTNGIPTNWTTQEESVPTPSVLSPVGYITLTNTGTNNQTIYVETPKLNSPGRLVYSRDGNTWNWLTDTPMNIAPGSYIYIAGDKVSQITSINKLILSGVEDGTVSASGNVRYLYDCENPISEDTVPQFALYSRFINSPSLGDISGLVFENKTLKPSCYTNMFRGCSGIRLLPSSLPSEILSSSCYANMFYGCTNLANIPTNFLPATSLNTSCYDSMFRDCTGITNAPKLPATTLASSCYYNMFKGCTSLTEAPKLPAKTLTTSCYVGMFDGCTNLNKVTTYATSWSTNYSTSWLNNVSATGEFYNLGKATIPTNDVSGIPSGWTEYQQDDLQFIALQGGSTVNFYRQGVTSEYSLDDGETWINGDNVTVTLTNVGDSVKYRGVTSSGADSGGFTLTGQIKALGSIMSMYNKDPNATSGSETNCFKKYFYGQTALKDITDLYLPATDLNVGAYHSMFEGCTGITSTPNIAQYSRSYNYYCDSMFKGCTGMTSAYLVSLFTLSTSQYYMCHSMFEGCTSLKYCIITTNINIISNNGQFNSMFKDCTNLSTVIFYTSSGYSSWDTTSFSDWLDNVSPTGTLMTMRYSNQTEVSNIPIGSSGRPSGWVKDYLTFTAEEANSTVKYVKGSASTSEYSLDGGETWINGDNVTVTLTNVGDSVKYRGTGGGGSSGAGGRFSLTGKIAGSGTIASMIDKDPNTTNYVNSSHMFYRYFYQQSALTKAPEITIASCNASISYVYDSMFYKCTSLTEAPVLYFYQLAGPRALQYMFDGCSSLNKVVSFVTGNALNGSQQIDFWLLLVSDTGDFYNLGKANYAGGGGVSGIPTGWTIHTTLD